MCKGFAFEHSPDESPRKNDLKVLQGKGLYDSFRHTDLWKWYFFPSFRAKKLIINRALP